MPLPIPVSFKSSKLLGFAESTLKQRISECSPEDLTLQQQVLIGQKMFPGVKRFTFSDLPTTPTDWTAANAATYLTRYYSRSYSGSGNDMNLDPWSYTSSDTVEGAGYTPQNSGMYNAGDANGTPTTTGYIFGRWPWPWVAGTGYPVRPSGVTLTPTTRECAGYYVLIDNSEWAETSETLSNPADEADHIATLINRIGYREHVLECLDFGSTGLPGNETIYSNIGTFNECNPGADHSFDTSTLDPNDYDMSPAETTSSSTYTSKFSDNITDLATIFGDHALSGWLYPTDLTPQESTLVDFGEKYSEPYVWALYQRDLIYSHRSRFRITGNGYRSYFIVKVWFVADYPSATSDAGVWTVPITVFPKVVIVSQGLVNEDHPVTVPLPTGDKFNSFYEPASGGKLAIGAACVAVVGEGLSEWLVRNSFELIEEDDA